MPTKPKTLAENLKKKNPDANIDRESTCKDCRSRIALEELYWYKRQSWRCTDCHPHFNEQ
jgi:hypothetical protein